MNSKKHYIVTTTDHNPLYYEFLPGVYKMWKKHNPDCIFVLGYIGPYDENHDIVKKLKKYCDELTSIKI